MRTHVVFRTSMFPDESASLANEEYLKPGKWLAEWLAGKLPSQGVNVVELFDEDWGWGVGLAGDCARIFVACSQVDDEPDQWHCFCEEENALSRWLLRLKGKENQMSNVVTAVAAILRAEPQIGDIGWFDIAAKNAWDDMSPDPFAPLASEGRPPKRTQQ